MTAIGIPKSRISNCNRAVADVRLERMGTVIRPKQSYTPNVTRIRGEFSWLTIR